ncbi:ATP-binding cassette domain-containing protein [Lactobacillus sp. ESL0731]|uniref:ATP-binding cassette domain-containing protein n=1 Tax=unclassified Lactobacillus TaxID=2620435 RepID=UPI0023F87CAE|nr:MULTISPECIES: ATP-binding cassette domain-containing protein [unclassified Lactobacillus]WEV51370.1 ATP-binding cassette domain-containing protein [Lactobacillus sp. ESL0700]WEV62500.1 ATP-binding cassette domain-containing protein [Lactobacillus sp. ESL0731]
MLIVDKLNVFIGHEKIVNQVSFNIKTGEVVGLIGPNGAGKTTIMKTVLGLTKFTGEVKVNNKKVTETNHYALANVGALIEHPAIYPFLTGRQNLELYSQQSSNMDYLIAVLEMNNYIDTKASGYSLGMKQKLGIAIAFLNTPQLIILDEPMNGLDIESTIKVRQLIYRYAKNGTAFLISSHILSELQKVMTENNSLAEAILETKKINFARQDNYLLVKPQNLYQIQDELLKQNVHLREMSPVTADFEQIVVNILANQRNQHD